MVLERLVTIKEAIRNPWWMFFVGGIISLICLLVSFLVFPTSVGIFTTFLITIAMFPFMINLITYEEARDESLIAKRKEVGFFHTHQDILKIYTAFFAGMILTFSLLYIILPENMAQKLFDDQTKKISEIRGMATVQDTFVRIITNNIGVLMLSFLLSFLYGAGAIFILAWNASVLSTAIGITAKTLGGIEGLPVAILTFFPHGSLEILAYFIGAIAGGLISAVITRRRTKFFLFVAGDGFKLMGISIGLLIIAGIIETVSIAL